MLTTRRSAVTDTIESRPGGEYLPITRGYAGETYYDHPALKPSPFGWRVAAYMFIAGVSGGAQVIATVASWHDGEDARRIVRHGRYLALVAPAVGPVLLIADLHTPQRWYNMLRIFRRTSPMSIGTYVLSAFGLSSVGLAAAQWLEDRGLAGDRLAPWLPAVQLPAGIAGAGMCVYTAALLAATSTPLWSAAPALLGIRFGSSSIATAAAVLSLVEQALGRQESSPALDRLALAAGGTELVASLAAERAFAAEGVAGPLQEPPWGPVHKMGVLAVGLGVPLVGYGVARLVRRPPRWPSLTASLALLAGGFLMRATLIHAGNRSAGRPQDYFRQRLPRPRREAR